LSTYVKKNARVDPFYWAGNEPDIFAPYLFSFSGRPDLTQKWTRWLLKNKYSILPDGIPGNDDYGTMSAWVIWSSIGLYPLAGSPTYILVRKSTRDSNDADN
jgi:putative alpha-1,2-mannosidase